MEEYVECRICGFKSKRIYGRHLKSHGITSEEYKKSYDLYEHHEYIKENLSDLKLIDNI